MNDLKLEESERACGVHPQLFEKMRYVLRKSVQRKIKPGCPAKLSLEAQLLMTLQYWRDIALLPYHALLGHG
jgi:hypothetical protein